MTFTFQSLDADLARLGDYGASNLYRQYPTIRACRLTSVCDDIAG